MALRVSSPVLVGRAAELATLYDALEAAGKSRSTTVLIAGEAGIGKTRLVRELAAGARTSGALVLIGGSVRLGLDDGLPYAPFVEALRGLVRERGADAVEGMLDASTAELASLLPELGLGQRDLVPGDQRPDWALTRLFEAMLVFLRRLGETGPVVLVVEDLHWADRSTRDLFAFLARTMTDERALLVGTYRSDELHRRHPLLGWIGEIDRLGARRIVLTGLTADEVRDQIEAITGRRPELRTVEAVRSRSGGNPFFAEELVATGMAEDRIPASLRDLLLARVGTLSPATQEMLGVASVSGGSVDHEVLAAVTGWDDDVLADTLREAVGQHVLEASADGGRSLYTFRHALLREAVEDDLLPRDRRRLHSRFAAVLGAQPVAAGAAGASQLAAVAHHADAAHELPLALSMWLLAARAAFRAHAAGESTHAFSRALELWDVVASGERPDGVELVDVLYEASFALAGTGDVHRALQVARRAVELAGPDDPERAARLLERQGRVEWLAGDLVSATATLERAVALVADGPATPVSASAVASMAGILMLRGQTRRAIEIGRQALDLATAAGAPGVVCFTLNTLGAALADQGECGEAIEVSWRGLALAQEQDRADELHRAYANLSTALQTCGRLEESALAAVEGAQWARRRGMWRLQGAFLDGNAAAARYEQGRWDEAVRLLDPEDAPPIEGVAWLNHTVTSGPLMVRTGRFDDAARRLDDARPTLGRLRDAQFTGPIYRALAELAIEQGRLAEVDGLVDEALELMAATDDLRHRAALLGLAVEAAAARARLDAARGARGEAGLPDRALAGRRLDELRALLAEDRPGPPRLHDEAAAVLAAATAEVVALDGGPAAEAWAEAARRWAGVDDAFGVATGRYREAEAHLTAGARREGEAALGEACQVARRLGAAPLEGRIRRLALLARVALDDEAEEGEAVARPADGVDAAPAPDPARELGLTAREAQVLELLAAGLTNRQIGEALFMSESTAGVHVSRIISKLGVTNRVEAAAVAVRSGLAD